MPWYLALSEHIVRAALLLALTVAPTTLSPEPPPSDNAPFFGLLSVLSLGALLYGAARFARHLGTHRARLAASLAWVAVAAALVAARHYSGSQAPLARAVPLVAVPVWGALALAASAAGQRWLASRWKHGATAALVAVLGLGALLVGGASTLLGSADAMWWSALRRDAAHPRALDALAAPARAARKPDDLLRIAEHCAKLHPQGCGCLALEAEAHLAAQAPDDAIPPARDAAGRCPTGPGRALLSRALAATGQVAEAEEEAREGLRTSAPEAPIRYALAFALERQGRYPDAQAEALRAVELGAGRDAQLFLGGLLIVTGDLDGAEKTLAPLVAADPSDADARYNLALIADHRGSYNKAREGYLATLKAAPKHANARYNLALLTFRHGVVEESRLHVQKHAAAWPDDPRLTELARTTGTVLR